MNSNLPIELKYLFENQYIQCMQILLVLFINRRKKEGITINELVYYITLGKCSEKLEENEYKIDFQYIQNNYFNYENNIRKNMAILTNKELIELNYKNETKKDTLNIKISENGIEIIEKLQSKYFKGELDLYNYLHKYMRFSNKNQKGVLFKYES